MKFLIIAVAFFWALLSLLIGALLMAMAADVVSASLLSNLIIQLYQSPNFSFVTMILGALFIFIAFLIVHLLEKTYQKEKTIVLNDKGGKTIMAVSVIEDLVKKSVENLLDLKEIKSKIMLRKKGIKIISKVTLFSTANIPQITDEIQKIIKEQVEKSLAIKEGIIVEIYVSKVVEKSEREKIKEERETARQITIGR